MIFFKEEDNELSFEANETIYVYVNYEGRYNLSKFLEFLKNLILTEFQMNLGGMAK